MDIVATRLYNQYLAREPLATVERVVSHFGAVQAQDYYGASWALSLRLSDASKADVDESFNAGRILRTHVLRPTWHFVLPEDIRWMIELTAPRIKQAMSYYNRKLELDETFFVRSHSIITNALAECRFLTRAELAQALARCGIEANGQRLGHMVMQAEIDGLICSGPLRGKQFTYALIDERIPNARDLGRDESLALLATRYFTSHGPATLRDFTWWSGLTAADAKLALDFAKRQLHSELLNGKKYWFDGELFVGLKRPQILLLSVYDEYVIAYQDYGPIFIDKIKSLTNIFGNARLDYVIVKDGLVVGTWHRRLGTKRITIEIKLEIELQREDHKLLRAAIDCYGRFLNLPVEVIEG